MVETTTSDSVLARLEVLETEIAVLKAENARLAAALTAPTIVARTAPATTSRRGMLRRVMHASAAAALLLVAREATTAEANSRTTVLAGTGSTSNYGIAAVESALDPALNTPPLGTTTHGVLGVYASSGPSPTRSAAVTGLGSSRGGILGVQGLSVDAEGVYGQSSDNAGVHGKSIANAGLFGEGPIGLLATGTGAAAVYGANNGGYGAWGNSASGVGVRGSSTSNVGVQAESTGHWGLHAKSPTYAGVFEGDVYVTGQVIALRGVFGVSGASANARASETGGLAEDVGEGTLANGRATVTLEQGFADAANGEYRVFLTELADLGGLYVVQKGPRQFEVRSRGGGQAAPSGRFDYRVVAKLSGPPGTRQAPPDLTTVKPVPKPPEPPKVSEPSGASDERRRP